MKIMIILFTNILRKFRLCIIVLDVLSMLRLMKRIECYILYFITRTRNHTPHPQMITSITLELVVSFVNFTTITTPRSDGARGISGCVVACRGHEVCGGIVWDVGQVSVDGVVYVRRVGCVGCGMLKYLCFRNTPQVCKNRKASNIGIRKGKTFFPSNSNFG